MIFFFPSFVRKYIWKSISLLLFSFFFAIILFYLLSISFLAPRTAIRSVVSFICIHLTLWYFLSVFWNEFFLLSHQIFYYRTCFFFFLYFIIPVLRVFSWNQSYFKMMKKEMLNSIRRFFFSCININFHFFCFFFFLIFNVLILCRTIEKCKFIFGSFCVFGRKATLKWKKKLKKIPIFLIKEFLIDFMRIIENIWNI